MEPVTVLTCPVCGGQLLYEGVEEGVAQTRMLEDVKTHLDGHRRLSEAKRGIFKHRVVATADEQTLENAESSAVLPGEWTALEP